MSDIGEVSKFLANTTPFSQLPAAEISRLTRQFNIYYYQAQDSVKINTDRLLIVRTGIFTLYSDQQQLLTKLQSGDFYGYQQLLTGLTDSDTLICEEDGLVYWLEAEAFHQCRYQ